MYHRNWPYSEMPFPKGPPSPQQKAGTKATWHAPTTHDFLKNLRWRARFGEIYAVVGAGEIADILGWSAAPNDERWVRVYTYPALGLRAMREAGLLPMRRVDSVPGLDLEQMYRAESSVRWLGDDPEFWLLEVPGVTRE